ncbi:MAG: hypothetical protein KGJ13_00055 [Patescibacteria group bacterium]|nr:hypothetical protein [Patescibacteria group bacterium]
MALSRRIRIATGFLAIVAVGYGVTSFWLHRNDIPQDFTDARQQGAQIAQQIVDLSNQSTAELSQVNQYDKQGDYTDALALTTQMVQQSTDLRNKAVDLSNQIGAMTKSLSDISSFGAQQAALESISSRLALINQLVNYSGDLGKLLDILQKHFTTHLYNNAEVQAAINQINTDVNAINNFNTQANRSMDTFDKLMNQ